MPRSEITTAMPGSRSIAAQPASPSAASQTSKELRITFASAARTALESSTTSTRGLSTVCSPRLFCVAGSLMLLPEAAD
jgi:hypothetical protein